MPATAPDPSVSASASSAAAASRAWSRRSAAACDRKKCATSTGCARRRCVYDGISAAPARSRLIGAGGHERRDRVLQRRNAAAQVQPQVERDLLVARAAGVQPAARVADPLDELALDEAVHVLVGPGNRRRIAASLLEDRAAGRRRWRACRLRTARRPRRAPPPTRGCRSRRLRRARDRSRTRCRSRTPRDRARVSNRPDQSVTIGLTSSGTCSQVPLSSFMRHDAVPAGLQAPRAGRPPPGPRRPRPARRRAGPR